MGVAISKALAAPASDQDDGAATLATDNYNMGRYGEVFLSSNGRQFQYTHLFTPSISGYAAYEADIALNRILIDDGRTDQNPLVPMPYLDPDVTLRAGSTITNMTGVLGYGFSYYRVQPTGLLTFTQSNPRVNTAVNGDLKFASMNVLNYFTTIDTGALICGPSCTAPAAAISAGQSPSFRLTVGRRKPG